MTYDFREDCYYTLDDRVVVERQIRERSRLDPGGLSMSVLETEDPGVFDINENLICAYADLDALIAACGMPDNERHIVEQQMAGYSMGDIATVLGCDGSDIMSLSTQAVKRIAKQNKASWSAMCRRQTAKT